MKTKKICFIVANLIYCAQFLVSCSSSQNEDKSLGDYESVVFKIAPKNVTSPLEQDQYTIDSVRSLIVPDSLRAFTADKFFVNDENIYILDSHVLYTVLVFDLNGKYLHKLGRRGRAQNEYPSRPEDFFVSKNGDVHVFDQDGSRILIFNNQGEFIKKITTSWVNSFGLTSTNKYIYCLDNMEIQGEEPDPALLMYDPYSDSKKALVPSKHYTYRYHPRYITFFRNDTRLSHIPILSDSVIVFKDDVVEKVVRFNFESGFLAKDKPELVIYESKGSEKNINYGNYPYVEAIYDYQETDSYILINYIYQSYLKKWLYNKRNKKIIHGDKLFSGLCVFNDYYLKGNQLIAYVGTENVELLNEYCESKEFDKEEFDRSALQVKALQSGKITAPALFYITIK